MGFTACFVCPHRSILPSTRIFSIYPCYDPCQCILLFMATGCLQYGRPCSFIRCLMGMWAMCCEPCCWSEPACTFVSSSRSFRVGLQAVNPVFPHLSMTRALLHIKMLFPWRQFSRADSSLLFDAWEVQHHFLWEASCYCLGRGHFSCCIQHSRPGFGYAMYHTVFR